MVCYGIFWSGQLTRIPLGTQKYDEEKYVYSSPSLFFDISMIALVLINQVFEFFNCVRFLKGTFRITVVV